MAIERSAAKMAEKEYATPPDVEKEPISPSITKGAPSSKILKHANDADEAMKAFQGYEGEVLVLDESTSKTLLRKIDLHLMPVGFPELQLRNGADFHR